MDDIRPLEDPNDRARAGFGEASPPDLGRVGGAASGPGRGRNGIGDVLGVEIERWLSQADGRLEELGVRPTELPRADDFGHVTAPRLAAPRIATLRREVAAAAPIRSERHGIFVAAGWGARARAE